MLIFQKLGLPKQKTLLDQIAHKYTVILRKQTVPNNTPKVVFKAIPMKTLPFKRIV